MLMTHAELVIQNALAFVAASRSARERDLERREKLLERIQLMRPPNPYLVKTRGGEQLKLDLDH
ncbi:hypothetical protein IE4872_PD01240 (plasmid) [Rhizobium gallicum]|uniref:Uncharacterized protein n=2 Tax=Rhizobium/Agrobacterium group TaxID=227290 RepID=A0A1L5NV38_9HYPH|nr:MULTISPECIES: hypothetical protein [Rhizobium]APO71767.1 hypothetical protein IE4872_PD01240 [Rhizobium gallicum]QPB23042.1 hypothetical protein ISN39_26205 [Rhizobium sp. 007]ULJ74848.1 hypothetical protein L2W42_31470 [Rhizobium gallicum]WFU89845.1 hypothetical protein QA644_27750 [Rhizobium sp. CC1099]